MIMFTNEKYTSQNYSICTVALFGNNEPFYFNGHLILRTYYADAKQTNIDIEKTSHFIADTLFYETNKVIRSAFKETYDEQRDVVVEEATVLNRPYVFVYNTLARPASSEETVISKLKLNHSDIHGLVIVLKKKDNGALTWLEEQEAREIEKTLTTIVKD